MLEKLRSMEEKYTELNKKAANPDVIPDQELIKEVMKEISDNTPIVEKYREY